MKRYSQRSGHTAMAELNVTPLLTSNVPLNLPTGSNNHTPPPDAKSIRTVSIDREGRVFLESKPVELPVLQQELTAFHDSTPDAAVIVRADKSINVQQFFDVIDVIQQAKIDRMSIQNVAP